MKTLTIPGFTRSLDARVEIPGSKSITNRALLLAALANGPSVISNALFSEDTYWFSRCLALLGIPVETNEAKAEFKVEGKGGQIPALEANLFAGNSGTTARFISALLALGRGNYRLDGVARMRERPNGDLLQALAANGAKIEYELKPGSVPFRLAASGLKGGLIRLKAGTTSQGVTALLLVAPYALEGVSLEIEGVPVSLPYLELTCRMMEQWGASVSRKGPNFYRVQAGKFYQPRTYSVEPDASGASYFFAAAALLAGRVEVSGLTVGSLQGDSRFVEVLEAMGCRVVRQPDSLVVEGPAQLQGIELDMNGISDLVPTLAAIAPFASSPVTIRNVAHIRVKETDRIKAVVTELRRLGGQVEEFPDGLKIYPGLLHPAEIETYEDHRIAMAFAVTGLKVPGLVIKDPGCTAKTFPDFFDRFFGMFS